MSSRFSALLITAAALLTLASSVEAACANKYVARQEGVRVVVTLLTGKLTFPEAKDLVKSVQDKKTQPVAWVDGSGKVIANSASVDAVRPMPVGCDGKSSGSVLSLTFLRNTPPSGPLTVRLTDETTVVFEQQKN
jgi:hypothetical protein